LGERFRHRESGVSMALEIHGIVHVSRYEGTLQAALGSDGFTHVSVTC
jgi:hypothetical protein